LLEGLPDSYSTPELNVACAEGEPREVIRKLLETAQFEGAREVITIDGLRVEYDDGFGLVRASNTTPVLVLRFEGHTPEALHRIEATMTAALRAVKPDAQLGASAH
jgi:phosphomannomutase